MLKLRQVSLLLISLVLVVFTSACSFPPNTQLDPSFNADPDQLGCAGVTPEAYEQQYGSYSKVEVTKLKNGYCYPSIQFHTPSAIDRCPEIHYHYRFFSIDGGDERFDSQPCGAVKQSDIVRAGKIHVPSSSAIDWNMKYEAYRQSVTGGE